jgi:hypothetical protein
LFDFTKTNMGIEVSWKYFANTHDSWLSNEMKTPRVYITKHSRRPTGSWVEEDKSEELNSVVYKVFKVKGQLDL